jgi:riboflavin kinase/FMN adenylyltransferase
MDEFPEMRIIEDARSTRDVLPNVVLTIGSFDGVHLGHQAILREVIEKARQQDGTPAVLTMRPHPREFFSPERPPNLLTDESTKARLLAEAGIAALFVLPFDASVAGMPKADFIDEIIVRRCHAVEVVVGHDFRFGKGAEGDYEFLEAYCRGFGIGVDQVPPVQMDGERVSSTLVRECLLQGDIDRAAQLIGRRYSIVGQVVRGRGIGTRLGYPTANIKPNHSAVPAQGVYAARAWVLGKGYPAAVNIGIAPTISHEDLTIEAHVLNFSGSITGEAIEVEFYQRIRSERKFSSKEALVGQIARDVETVRKTVSPSA